MMHLIEILLPLGDDTGNAFPAAQYEGLSQRLTERFGGVTSFARSPAQGSWRSGDATEHDDIIVLEVMAEDLDREWWTNLRNDLMREFRQDDIVIRSHEIERLR
jgi:hypothetical protein